MHDLKAIYVKVKGTIKEHCKEYFVFEENIQKYPRSPKMTDLEVISLSITAECLQIDSENLLWSKLQTDYSELFPQLPHRTKFNKRRKRLVDILGGCIRNLSEILCAGTNSKILIIDSMPIPTCRLVREYNSKACRQSKFDEVLADKGINAIMGGWFIGYKFHLITTETGIYKEMMISSASVHDNYFLKLLDDNHTHLKQHELVGDRAYIGKAIQLSLFEDLEIKLNVPYRSNQKDFIKYEPEKKIIRKTIEVIFSQYCDEFNIKKNYAKRFEGLYTRIVTKVSAKTFKQFINFINGKPINQTKHALAA